ncbi:MAG: hypothetical protein KGL20_05240 [Rhodospirillales bacterium]|nr:hypothetical protein [Rhodospirillales bacterium]MDE2458623.1 hypothetical protein [Rhodospirillales bacterium]
MFDGELADGGWKDVVAGGRTYSLSHLQPFTIQVPVNEDGSKTYKLYVSFGCHTFTKKWTDEEAEDHRIRDGGSSRCFCVTRHAQSLSLPAIIHAGVRGRAYFSQKIDYLLVEDFPGLSAPYVIFFRIEKAKSSDFDAAMFVVSAYEKPGLPKNLPRILFKTLLDKTVKNQKIIRPKK